MDPFGAPHADHKSRPGLKRCPPSPRLQTNRLRNPCTVRQRKPEARTLFLGCAAQEWAGTRRQLRRGTFVPCGMEERGSVPLSCFSEAASLQNSSKSATPSASATTSAQAREETLAGGGADRSGRSGRCPLGRGTQRSPPRSSPAAQPHTRSTTARPPQRDPAGAGATHADAL